jgi:hypothetical protein
MPEGQFENAGCGGPQPTISNAGTEPNSGTCRVKPTDRHSRSRLRSTCRIQTPLIDHCAPLSPADSGKHVMVEEAFHDAVLVLERGTIKPCRDDDDELVRGNDVNSLATPANSSDP